TTRVSTSFLPNSHPAYKPDIILVTSDSVLFHVCTSLINLQSPHAFETMLASPLRSFKEKVVPIDLHSEEMNIIMYIAYGKCPISEFPTLLTIITAIDRMPLLGMTPKDYLVPECPFYSLLLTHTSSNPMEIYCLAGRHGLDNLAISSSGFLLSVSPLSVTDEQAQRMGGVAFKRLMCLHDNRICSLRNLLLQPPRHHPATVRCNFADQRTLFRSWTVAGASILYHAHLEISSGEFQNDLTRLARVIRCEQCSKSMQDRIKDALKQWMDIEVR
ncbi:hypothetical protein BJ165DRAFT_1329731, partial [Panaeolus papilionaceus]